MTIDEFKEHLRRNPGTVLRFQMPDGGLIPVHAHVTEVGRVDKTFVDCGGTVRQVNSCLLQTWVAGDFEHRLPPGKLADILDRATGVLRSDEHVAAGRHCGDNCATDRAAPPNIRWSCTAEGFPDVF